jgi:hypothetical protein
MDLSIFGQNYHNDEMGTSACLSGVVIENDFYKGTCNLRLHSKIEVS